MISELSFRPMGEHNSGLNISTAQTLTVPHGAQLLMIQALTRNVRMTLDGTAPTSSKGFQLRADDPPIILPCYGVTIKVIQEAATASLQYQFGGYYA